MSLKEKARQLPDNPGVYIMKDSQANIIYIGKAKKLNNRVSQYFQSSAKHAPKILRMIEGIRDFDYILADTELEALLLECRLIKDIKPMYNSQLKNHQKYVYININFEDQYPTLETVSEKQGKGINFGPYNSLNNVERAVKAIKQNIRVRHCNSLVGKNSGCLNHQLGFCIAPCTGKVPDNEYKKLIEEVIDLLKGGRLDIIKGLKSKMIAAAEALDFDKAARHRDDIRALGHIVNKQKTIKFTQSSRNIMVLERISEGLYKLFIIKGSRVIYKERLDINQDKAILEQHIIDLIIRYKDKLRISGEVEVNKADIDQAQIVYSYIKNKKECSHISISKSWLKKEDIDKLQQGVQKLLDRLKE